MGPTDLEQGWHVAANVDKTAPPRIILKIPHMDLGPWTSPTAASLDPHIGLRPRRLRLL
ncbi:hypothetical protein DB30_04487 [Enhygromyxa salina]|uniref:Uncharacterized protein n=1 Tax=Enhygromyxa salina TaxID=215803 RepID=A0A0C1ZYX3_9BACT|nr:hypothetical protein DB30_04487 [Enhygromyxa salina]